MANTYLGISTTSSGTRTKWTTSFWVKRNNLSNENTIFAAYLDNDNKDKISFNSDGTLQFASFQAGSYSNGGNLITERKFLDCNAWYHIVCRWDSSNATANDRMKIWVNGEEMSDFSSRTNPTSGRESLINYQQITVIGRMASNYLDGCLSHVHFCDNQLYQASDFGETDATTGEWKIKTSPSVSYGTTGYFALKDGNSLTDQSSNSNNLTLQGGTLTKTEDSPSNIFCTMNPLDYNSTTIEEGNNRIAWSQSAGNFAITTGTIGMTTGKYYWEAKVTSDDNSTGIHLGVLQTEPYISRTTSPTVNTSLFYGLGIRLATDKSVYRTSNGTDSSISDTWSNNSVIRIAYDGDAGKIYMWKDATEFNGQTFSSNTSFNSATLTAGTMVLPFIGFGDGGSGTKNAHANFNFGNGYFGSTVVSSVGTNASGNGIFEYDVPTGYTALSTKGLNL